MANSNRPTANARRKHIRRPENSVVIERAIRTASTVSYQLLSISQSVEDQDSGIYDCSSEDSSQCPNVAVPGTNARTSLHNPSVASSEINSAQASRNFRPDARFNHEY